ncbi:MAG: UDP-N-acetylmuramate--L-alanine ligase [Planctomycetota bacterium]|nr:UDP-N-acetylmuramate--L-alanine ligase [Planctomycetota bacterium]
MPSPQVRIGSRAPASGSSTRLAASLAGLKVHFMGAGGIGMSALMELARARGAEVSGCDGCAGGQVPHLRAQGLPVAVGHDPSHAEACDVLVYSPAVPDDHPELLRARALGKPVHPRMSMLGRVARSGRVIGVTGSHGKTTITWMIAHLLLHSGRDPDVLVGGVVASLGSNVRVGKPDAAGLRELVLEVDESDNRLHEIRPSLPVVSNIDNDHLEHYGGLRALEAAITTYLASAGEGARRDEAAALIGCGDDPRVRAALEMAVLQSGLPMFDYGFEAERTVRGENVRSEGMRVRFDARGPFGTWRGIELPMPGAHNALNALAALSVGWRLGLGEDAVRAALACCERVGRRFEVKGEVAGVRVVDDYGHHPAELAVTLRAARDTSAGRVAVLFQPHRYTRTQALLDEFARVLAEGGAEAVLLLPVYAASEAPIAGADHASLAARLRARGHACAEALDGLDAAVERLAAWARPGDTVLVQGAGDVTEAAPLLLERLRR